MATMQKKILITRPDVPQKAIDLLKGRYELEIWHTPRITRQELLASVKGKNAIFAFVQDQIDAEFLDAAGPQLKVIGTMSVGSDHINVPECKKRGVIVGYTPDVLTDAVAELTIGLLLATTRRLIEANKAVTNGLWANTSWAPLFMCGTQLKGSVVGIVGFGRIGSAVAKRLVAFDVKEILYYSRSSKPEAEIIAAKAVSFDTLLKKSDIVINCAALTNETNKMFNKAAFDMMKPTAIFINTSRGGLVDQDALVEVLKQNKIKAAGLDVMTPEPLPVDHPLTTLPNCVLLPHIGSAATETRIGMAVMTAQNIISGLEVTEMPARLC